MSATNARINAMWIRKVPTGDRSLVARAVIQTTRVGTYMSVQDRHGAILGTARWERRITYREATELLRADNLFRQGEWRQPRQGVFVVYVTDVR